MTDLPPKPQSRTNKVSLLHYMRLFRQDILSAQPARFTAHGWLNFARRFFAVT